MYRRLVYLGCAHGQLSNDSHALQQVSPHVTQLVVRKVKFICK